MNPAPELITLRAAWVIPIDQPPIPDGVVTIKNKRIVSITSRDRHKLPVASKTGEKNSESPWIDLGDVILAPAWVNAHTHLEFSDLLQPLGMPGIEFTDWIRMVVAHRRSQQPMPPKESTAITNGSVAGDTLLPDDDLPETNSLKRLAIVNGLQESIDHGVGLIGEIATQPCQLTDYLIPSASTCRLNGWDVTAAIDSGVHGILFLEQLGRDRNQYPKFQQQLESFLQHPRFENSASGAFASNQDLPFNQGLSPHAPYSVPSDLADLMVNLAKRRRCAVAMHLAETEAERELLQSGTGSLVAMLKDFGVWDQSSFSAHDSIETYLRILAIALRSLVVHGNYLNEQEMDLIADHRQRMSVVFCPRTHRYFAHAEYPLIALLKKGICVAVGTDSKASNPDLNLFEELKEIQLRFPLLSPQQILEMGTINGARALGLQDDWGSLTPGKRACFSVITGSPGLPNDWRGLFDATSRSISLGDFTDCIN